MSKSTKRIKPGSLSPEARKAYKAVEPVLSPLIELFSIVDAVFEEPNAFSTDHINKSLGRIYREWLNTREALDPEFDRERYRQRMKKAAKPLRTGLTVRPVAEPPKSSTGRRSISEKNRKKSERPGKKSPKTSAKRVRSDGRA